MNRFLMVWLLLFQRTLNAQIQLGFDLLRQKDTSKAQIAFEKDRDHSKKGIIAQYGLCLIRERRMNLHTPADSFLAVAQQLLELEAKLNSASAFRRRKCAKYGVSLSSIRLLRGKVRAKSVKPLIAVWGVLDYDRFIQTQPRLAKDFDYDLKKVRRAVVQRDYTHARDYATLYSLNKNHLAFLHVQHLNLSHAFESKLFSAFLEDVGIIHFDNFRKEFPKHRISSDCWSQDLATAYKQNGRLGALQFLIQHKNSILDVHIISDILRHRKQLGELNEAEQKQLDYLIEHEQLEWELNDLSARNAFQRTLDYARREAPTRRSLEVVKQATQRLMDLDSIALATELLETLQSLYPDGVPNRNNCARFNFYTHKQMWFDTARALLKRPETQRARMPLTDINTLEEEFSPVISADGKTLYFCGTNRAEDSEVSDGNDIYVSDWKNGHWTSPTLVPALSGKGNQAPLSLTPNGLTMLLFHDGKLHLSRYFNSNWTTPRPLHSINNAFAWVGRATLSADSRVLILEASKTLDAVSGDMEVDLYMSFRSKDTIWSMPVPLPAPVRTPFAERSPYLHSDNRTLYFASDGHPGLGEMDIFKTTRLDNSWLKWSKPYNIGRKFNTIHDDWGLNFSVPAQGNIGYFSAATYSEYGNDLYSTGIPPNAQPEPTTVLELPVKITGQLNSYCTLSLFDKLGNLIRRERVQVENGRIITTFPQDSVARFVLESPNRFPYSESVSRFQSATPDSIHLVPVKEMIDKNMSIPLPAIEFDKSKKELRLESLAHLDILATFLSKQPWSITIIGHTDDSGRPHENLILSQLRAESVKAYLLTKVPALKVQTQGLGSTQPKVNGDSEAARQVNRRVEIKIQNL
jgi:outer membrane protein OmpA-like peptidoglycan-associated protein